MTDQQAGVALGFSVAFMGLIIGLAGPFVVIYQGLLWLREGFWTPFGIRHVLSIIHIGSPIADPSLSWRGVQNIIVWVLDSPLSIGLAIVGWLICLSGVSVMDAARDASSSSE
jgi:hypothetical protein